MWLLCGYVRISAPGEQGPSRTNHFPLCMQLLPSSEVVWIVFGAGGLCLSDLCSFAHGYARLDLNSALLRIDVDERKLPREASSPQQDRLIPVCFFREKTKSRLSFLHTSPSCTVCSSDSHDISWRGSSFSKNISAWWQADSKVTDSRGRRCLKQRFRQVVGECFE